MTTWGEVPAGAGDATRATPAGCHGDEDEHAAQRDAWRRAQAAHRRGSRGSQWRRRAARGTLRAGMIRRPPEPGGDDAA